MNYGEIKNLVSVFMKRSDLDVIYPQIFELVRERISKDARLIEMEVTQHYDLTDAFQDLPTDFIEMRSVIVNVNGAKRPLRFYTKQALDALTSRSVSTPIGYTLNAGQIEVRPIAGDTSLDITYFSRPSNLADDNDTNDVLTNYPSLYLYAALIYAANSLQDTETENVSAQNYTDELRSANESSELAKFSGDAPTMTGG